MSLLFLKAPLRNAPTSLYKTAAALNRVLQYMEIRKVGIIMNGVTGRMGTNQHLIRSILAIMQQGGVKISDDLTLIQSSRVATKTNSVPWPSGLASNVIRRMLRGRSRMIATKFSSMLLRPCCERSSSNWLSNQAKRSTAKSLPLLLHLKPCG